MRSGSTATAPNPLFSRYREIIDAAACGSSVAPPLAMLRYMVGCSGVWVSARQPPSANSPMMATIARMTDRAPERAAAGRSDLHVMAANEQLCGPGRRAVGDDVQRLAAKLHAAVADLDRQHDGFADKTVHERGGRIVIDVAGRADLLDAALV